MSWPQPNLIKTQTHDHVNIDSTSDHRWCSHNTGSCNTHPLQENVIESTSTTTTTGTTIQLLDSGCISDTDSGLGVVEACENLSTMPGPPTRGRKGARDTPRTPKVDNPEWQVRPQGSAEEAPTATTSSALPGTVCRTDNAPASLPGTSGGAVLHSLRDPSHYEELSVIGNGKQAFIL